MLIQDIINKKEKEDNYIASLGAKLTGLRKDGIKRSLFDCNESEHRLEYVGKVRDVEFINDSRSTNVTSTWIALEKMDRPLIWIAGGVDNGNDYYILKEIVKDKVDAIICLGKENSRLHKSFAGMVKKIVDTTNATDAVRLAFQLSKPGYTVILSPACPSFDLFESYEDRGRQFKKAVKEL
ncbi:MAG: cyanophycin synthetase [Bacteroidota bacterium]|nr:cyanophycin synthetase [Bacteroidota bacterium]